LTDHSPTIAPGTLSGRARAPGRPSTVARRLATRLWATGLGRLRPSLDCEPRRTPGLEVTQPSHISLTPQSIRLDLPLVPPRERPASASHHTIKRRRPLTNTTPYQSRRHHRRACRPRTHPDPAARARSGAVRARVQPRGVTHARSGRSISLRWLSIGEVEEAAPDADAGGSRRARPCPICPRVAFGCAVLWRRVGLGSTPPFRCPIAPNPDVSVPGHSTRSRRKRQETQAFDVHSRAALQAGGHRFDPGWLHTPGITGGPTSCSAICVSMPLAGTRRRVARTSSLIGRLGQSEWGLRRYFSPVATRW
jgi:hypothetical protein